MVDSVAQGRDAADWPVDSEVFDPLAVVVLSSSAIVGGHTWLRAN